MHGEHPWMGDKRFDEVWAKIAEGLAPADDDIEAGDDEAADDELDAEEGFCFAAEELEAMRDAHGDGDTARRMGRPQGRHANMRYP